MTPYTDPSYFLLLLYPLLALVVLGVVGRLGRVALLLVSVAVVLYQYGDPEPSDAPRQLIFLGIYAVASTGVVLAYARTRNASQAAFYAAVAVALLPLVAVKVWPLVRGGAESSPIFGANARLSFPPGVPAPRTGLLEATVQARREAGIVRAVTAFPTTLPDAHSAVKSAESRPVTVIRWSLRRSSGASAPSGKSVAASFSRPLSPRLRSASSTDCSMLSA